jgi:hypothetical protein
MERFLRAQDQEWKCKWRFLSYKLGMILIRVQKVIFHLEAFVAKFMRLYEG